jgi:phage/plasmid-associated DNA primase
MVDFTAKFITLFVCNDIPECDDIDNAFSKRLRCINFPTEFVDNPKNPNQKKIDVNINKNFEYWKNDFMLLLIENYRKYKETHILTATDNIMTWTDKYKEDTDLYLQFMDSILKKSDDEKDKLHCSIIYNHFKTWFKENNPATKIPSNKEFINEMRKHTTVEKLNINGLTQLGIKKYILINY